MNRLKEMRKENKITLVDLSAKLGIPRSTLNRYENGESEPKKETWEKLANYFNVSIGYLMGVNDQKMSEEKALNIAKKVYQSYLSDDDLDKETRKALEYFNTDDLDSILQQAMGRYFTVPALAWNTDWQSLENKSFLYKWLEWDLVGRYREEVKTNQNLITNTYHNIPSTDDINGYADFPDEIQIPVTKNFLKTVHFLPKEQEKEIMQLINSDTILIAHTYESSIDDELKDELNKILNDTRDKIKNLKTKYSDKKSNIEQLTVLISRKDDSLWYHSGESDNKDELNLSDTTKQLFVHLASEFIKEKKNISIDENKN
ncbi:DNA-binding helix-turn-helix protein [Enterococcus faecalis 13-SD-W-01]|nr:DNA-binding helix-turn-helix protein [Enterococcus faecalis 13-SD-W-01]